MIARREACGAQALFVSGWRVVAEGREETCDFVAEFRGKIKKNDSNQNQNRTSPQPVALRAVPSFLPSYLPTNRGNDRITQSSLAW